MTSALCNYRMDAYTCELAKGHTGVHHDITKDTLFKPYPADPETVTPSSLDALGETPMNWKSVALLFGEGLASNGPTGYYDFTPDQWLDWARGTLTTLTKGQRLTDTPAEKGT